ncbi:MAG: arsenic resistance N-acetyltransferase ArsN2 [Halobacteriales archaeon]|nr:arsenic resistance N-acetyltransferase ArsN2 [Halobacteriales archaeon]
METELSVRTVGPADIEYVEGLLAANDLPTADISELMDHLYVFETDGERIGVGGLEPYADVGLLRSVAIEDACRGQGYGSAVCRRLLAVARQAELSTVYLLTTTAEEFFARLGFEVVDRTAVPHAIRQTREFSDLCPTTAVCMRRGVPADPVVEASVE